MIADMPEMKSPAGSASVPNDFSFSVLGRSSVSPLDSVSDVSARDGVGHWAARKACAALRVTSSIINAVVVHPGADCDDAQLREATNELMQRSAVLTDAAVGLLQLSPDSRGYAGHKNLLRQQAAELVAAQWRMANATGKEPLTTEQITTMYQVVLDSRPIEGAGEIGSPYPEGMDAVTAKRVSLLAATPEIYDAVNSFDYFFADEKDLLQKGVSDVLSATDRGLDQLLGSQANEATRTMVTQALIGKNAGLYAANYRAMARRDVLRLQKMEPVARTRHIYEHRATGLPVEHISSSFQRLSTRMVQMVCEAVPELAMDRKASPAAATVQPEAADQALAPSLGRQ
jgi:hypothetical protein